MGASAIAITILVDNQAGPGLTTEHGFSLWIETDGRRILFDTGQGPALPMNARTLGVDLQQTDMLVLSHGHYDHTGGIPHVLQVAPNAHVYCHPGVVQPRYSLRNGSPKPAHMPSESMAALDRLPEKNLHWTSEAVRLSENIGLTGPIPRQTTFEDTGGAFFLDPEARHADPIEDDLALWIKTDQGLVVCVGCCHAGIINTLTHVRRLSGVARIRAVIGGLHPTRTAVLIFSDAGAARNRYSYERVDMTRAFLNRVYQSVRYVAWLNPMPAARWANTSAAAIAGTVPMFEVSHEGLQNAISVLRGRTVSRG